MASMTLGWPCRALILGLVGGMVSCPTGVSAWSGQAPVAAEVRAEIAANGETTFLVQMTGKADLTSAGRERGKARAVRVFQDKTGHAERSQARLRRLLRQRGATFTPYWIVNAVRVTGGAALLAEVAAQPGVERVLPDRRLPLLKTRPGVRRAPVAAGAAAATVEWNVAHTGASRVWSQLGVHGEGIVVASIDTGVQADHPALAAGYRGRGAATHNYHWYDPTGVCPDTAPCDNNGHGTHTMGTMVGGGSPSIGLAPGARWIAAKGCESDYCTTSSLLAAGQWIAAPTDLRGDNPRPDLAPDVVNNSWGSSGFDPWYQEVVESWVAAGIFPAFAAGNAGAHCASVGTPGGYDLAYASGALNIDGAIADFSSRGTALDELTKPNIAAPGVDVRSAVPDGEYEVYSGTSMASPHTAAAVALLWSAVPALSRDIAATREVLDGTAADVADSSCGGTSDNNNVYGQGRLDAYAALTTALYGAGSLSGSVRAGRAALTPGAPLPGASVTVRGPITRQVPVNDDGAFRIGRLPLGQYTVTATTFGYRESSTTVEVAADDRVDLRLDRLPHGIVSGTVRSPGGPLPGVLMTLADTPVTTRTDAAGRYRLEGPLGRYELRAEPVGQCASGTRTPVTVRQTDSRTDLTLTQIVDGYGYTCGLATTAAYIPGSQLLELTGDDAVTEVALPFPVELYGTAYQRAWISTNGLIGFAGPLGGYGNTALPDPTDPNAALYPFWDDLVVDEHAAVYVTETPDLYLVEWRNVRFFAETEQRLSISAAINRDGVVTYGYQGLSGEGRSAGSSATIGLEGAGGAAGLAFSVNSPVLTAGAAVTFRPPAPPSVVTAGSGRR